MEYKLEILKSIVELGSSTYPNIADPSESEILKSSGVASVTSHIEKLSLMGLVQDAQPLFGKNGGMWIGYSLSEQGKDCADDPEKFKAIIAKFEKKPTNEVSNSVRSLVKLCEKSNINENYKDDFVKTLNEIAICFENDCYIATITVCGKILEICLIEILQRNDLEYNNRWMIGKLLSTVKEEINNEYIDPSLESVGKIISKSRNSVVHCNEKIPIPSRDQTIMVIFATRDVVSRNLTKSASA